GLSSGYSSVIPNPREFAGQTNPLLWEIMLGGKGVFSPDGYHYEYVEGSISRTGKLGILLMDFVGSYNTIDIRNDMIRRNLSK
ncbi:MAG: hypothetical protein GYA55_07090, partial [SAR324 cluster bacterium]|nr:hypothetical protein [SAR324 cluster bacterium]